MMDTPNRSHRQQAGISLVEIMVAMVIGLIATLVVMQVFSVFEGQKRTTSGNADAQTNGTVALFAVTRDIQRAGFGLFPSGDSGYDCTNSPQINGIGIAPIEIVDGGAAAGASDTIRIHFGDSQFGAPMAKITSAPANMTITNAANTDVTGSTVTVPNNMSCQANDIALLTNGPTCMLRQVTDTSSKVAGLADFTRIVLNDTTDVSSGTTISCLGAWRQVAYSVDTAARDLLIDTTPLNDDGTPVVSGIVNMQAQYGVAATADSNLISQWVNATGTWDSAAISVADRNRIKAIRIAIVARNELLERDAVPGNAACSSLTAPAPTGLCAWEGTAASPAPAIDLSNDANWANHRYRVFETIIPLRNVIWAKSTF